MHILNGDSAGGSFKSAFKLSNDEMIIFHDVLSCGPLQKFDNIENWVKFRYTFWETDVYQQESGLPLLDSFPRDFYQYFPAASPASDYKLWIGTGLSDQLLLASSLQSSPAGQAGVEAEHGNGFFHIHREAGDKTAIKATLSSNPIFPTAT